MNMTTVEREAPPEAALAATPAALPDAAPQRHERHDRHHRLMPAEFLSFRLGSEEYGVDILRVREIRSYEAPTRIANAAPFVKGVVNLRGLIVPVVDLRLKFACDHCEYTAFTMVIVLNVLGRVVGAVVDSVSDVLALGPDDIKPAPAMNATVDADYILGIGCVSSGDVQRMLILTDIEALMGSADMGLAAATPLQ